MIQRKGALAQKSRRIDRDIDDRRRGSHPTVAGIQVNVDGVPQLIPCLRAGRRNRSTGDVGSGESDRTQVANELSGNLVQGNPDGDRPLVEATDIPAHGRMNQGQDRQRSGPEMSHELAACFADPGGK